MRESLNDSDVMNFNGFASNYCHANLDYVNLCGDMFPKKIEDKYDGLVDLALARL